MVLVGFRQLEHAIRHLTPIALCWMLAACAEQSAKPPVGGSLLAEVRALREEQARLAEKVDRLEAQQRLLASVSQTAKSNETNESHSGAPLAVVKLKKREGSAPPRLSTAVPVVEPAEIPVPETDATVLEAEFQDAVDSLKTGNVEGGVAKLERFAKENPRHARADNALYFSALGHMGMEEYDAAAQLLERLLSRYPAGDVVPDALLKLAECRVRQKQAEDARALYSKVIAFYPGTAAASYAQTGLSQLKGGAP